MTDTEGILDRCEECGALARFRDGAAAGPSGLFPRHVQCTECANSIDYTWTQEDAMVEWNEAQRAMKARKAAGV